MKIHVSGSVAYDRIMNFPGLFEDHIIPDEIRKLNVSFAVEEFTETFGGSAGNIVYNLHLLKERPITYAAVGNDFAKYQRYFSHLKIDLSKIKIYPQTLTPAAYIITDQKDNQICGFFAGAMKFKATLPKAAKSDLAIIAPGNPNEVLDLVEYYATKEVPFIFDPGQQIIQYTRNQLRRAIKLSSIYIVNDYELSLTLKITGYDKAILLRNAGVLITTLGAEGSAIEVVQANKSARVNINAVKAKISADPTGCGDAYRAGLIKGLLISGYQLTAKNYLKIPWLKVGQVASLTAVYAVEKYGTQTHYYTFDQFKKRYQQEFKTKLK